MMCFKGCHKVLAAIAGDVMSGLAAGTLRKLCPRDKAADTLLCRKQAAWNEVFSWLLSRAGSVSIDDLQMLKNIFDEVCVLINGKNIPTE